MIRKNHILFFITNLLLILGSNSLVNAQNITKEKEFVKVNKPNKKSLANPTGKKNTKTDTIRNKENLTKKSKISNDNKTAKNDTIIDNKLLNEKKTPNKKATAPNKNSKIDTITYKKPYGLRIGIDISKPIIKLIYKNSEGLEFVSDYRVTKRLFLATEFGFEKVDIDDKVMNFTTKGNFMKFGLNYNGYTNWFDMNDEVYFGLRFGSSKFETKLNSFIPNYSNKYYPAEVIKSDIVNKNLKLEWIELQMGTKVETFKNLYIGLHVSYKIVTKSKEVDGVKNLHSPGFNRVYDNDAGFGFNYTISYLIPFYHK